jgi:hypothetical protein
MPCLGAYGRCNHLPRRQRGVLSRHNLGQVPHCRPGCLTRAPSRSADPRAVRGSRSAEEPCPHHRRRHQAWSTIRHGCGQALRPKPYCVPHRWRRDGLCRWCCPGAQARPLAGSGARPQKSTPTTLASTSAASGGRRLAIAPVPPASPTSGSIPSAAPTEPLLPPPRRTSSTYPEDGLNKTAKRSLVPLPRMWDLLHHKHQRPLRWLFHPAAPRGTFSQLRPMGVVQVRPGHGRVLLESLDNFQDGTARDRIRTQSASQLVQSQTLAEAAQEESRQFSARQSITHESTSQSRLR